MYMTQAWLIFLLTGHHRITAGSPLHPSPHIRTGPTVLLLVKTCTVL
jgi:hypothetical protein